jgi:hypothetical protein
LGKEFNLHTCTGEDGKKKGVFGHEAADVAKRLTEFYVAINSPKVSDVLSILSRFKDVGQLNDALFLRYGATLDSTPSELAEARRKQEAKGEKNYDRQVEREMPEFQRKHDAPPRVASLLGDDTQVVGVEQLSKAELEHKLEEEVERSYRLVQQLEGSSSYANSTTTTPRKTTFKVLEPSKPEQKDDLGASIEGLLLRADKTLQQYLPVKYNQKGGGGGVIPGTLSQHYNSFDSLDDSLLDSERHQGEPPLGDYAPKPTTRSATRPPGLPQLQLSMLQPQPPMAQAEHRSKTPKGVPVGPYSDALPPRPVYDTGQGYLPLGHSAHSNQMQQQQHHPPSPPPQQQHQQGASRPPSGAAYIQQPVPPLPMQGQQETPRSGPPSQPSSIIVLQGQPTSTINTHLAQQQQPKLEQRGAVTPRSTVITTPRASQQQITTPRTSQQQVGNTQQQVSSTMQHLGMATTPRLSQHGTYAHNSPRPVMTQRPPLPTQQQQMLLQSTSPVAAAARASPNHFIQSTAAVSSANFISPRPLSSPSHLLTSGMRVCVCLSACTPSCARACSSVHAYVYAHTHVYVECLHTHITPDKYSDA